MHTPEHLLTVGNRLGETPIWVPEEQALYWVDWGGRDTCRYTPADGETRTYPVFPPVTALARRASGGLLAIAQDGIYGWDPRNNTYERIAGPPDPAHPQIIYNDAAVDRQGRLLVGTVDMDNPFAPAGSLFRLDPDGSLHELDTGYATANGIGLSLDGRTIYVADQRNRQIITLDYDTEAGTVSNRRVFARVPDDEGMPDGIVVDAEGYIWSGHWDGWRLTRYAPDGRIDRQIRFPVQHVISFAFGGPELDELYVTTSCWGFSDEERQQHPWAGDLFHLQPQVRGLLEPPFLG